MVLGHSCMLPCVSEERIHPIRESAEIVGNAVGLTCSMCVEFKRLAKYRGVDSFASCSPKN